MNTVAIYSDVTSLVGEDRTVGVAYFDFNKARCSLP